MENERHQKTFKTAQTHCRNFVAIELQTSTCENEAFVRDFPQKLKVEDVKAKLSCETSLKNYNFKM